MASILRRLVVTITAVIIHRGHTTTLTIPGDTTQVKISMINHGMFSIICLSLKFLLLTLQMYLYIR